MSANNATTESGGFTAEERAAMKKRAAELRVEGKKGAKKADGLQAVLDSIAVMAPQDRALAERVHETVTAAIPCPPRPAPAPTGSASSTSHTAPPAAT